LCLDLAKNFFSYLGFRYLHMSKRITTKTTTTTTPPCHQENRGQPKYHCDASGLCSSGRLPCPSHLRLQRGHTHTTPGQVLQKQRQEGMRELEGSQRLSGKRSPLCFKQTLIRYRIFRPTEACGSRSNLFVTMTCEHANSTLSSTCPQSIGWDREPGGGWGGAARAIWLSPGPWHLRTRGMGSHHPV
jgi:hypothetical protein